MPDPLSISELKSTIRRVKEIGEIGAIGGEAREDPPPPTIEVHWLQITSTTKTANRYPARRYDRIADPASFTQAETCWLDTPNGEGLSLGIYYPCKLSGVRLSDDLVIYDVMHRNVMARGKLDGNLSVGGNAVMSIWRNNGATEVDTGDNVSVYDWLGKALVTNDKVVATFDERSGLWYVTSFLPGSLLSAKALDNEDITDNTEETLSFGALGQPLWDTGGFFDPVGAPTRMTFATAGKYHVGYDCIWASGTGTNRVRIRLNGGSTYYATTWDAPVTGGLQTNCASTLLNVSAGDYLQLLAFQDNSLGIARNVDAYFWVHSLS